MLRKLVNLHRNNFFSATALAHEQNRNIDGRDVGDDVLERAHRGTGAPDIAAVSRGYMRLVRIGKANFGSP